MMRNVTTVGEPSPNLVTAVAARIDAAVCEASGLYEVSALLKLTEEEKSGPLGAVTMAFDYMLGTHGDEFGAMREWPDGRRYPPGLKDVPPEIWNWWAAAGGQVSVPLARARLYDLCFAGGWGNRGEAARAAAESYLRAAARAGGDGLRADPGRDLDRAGNLRRALTLARKVRDNPLADRVIADIVVMARESLRDSAAKPGVVLGLLRILAEDRTPPADVDQMLADARDRYRDDSWHSATVIAFQMKRAGTDPDIRAGLQQEAVQVWIDEADRTAGLSRMKNLETAIKLARDYGLPGLADTATSRLQAAAGSEDLGLKAHTSRFTLPDHEVEAYFSQFTDAPSWQDAVETLIAGDPPAGSACVNRDLAAEAAADAVFYALIPKTRLGGDHLPRFTASTDEQRQEWLVAEVEIFRINMMSGLIAEALRRVWSTWGPISESELAAYLGQRTHVPGPLAAVLARGFIRHFTGDFEGAAYAVTPKIEALARSIALACGLPLYRTQREKVPGQYPGLGAILPELRKAGLNESWYRFLHTYLASVAGANTRNELLHGFMDEITETASALILTAALDLAVAIKLNDPSEIREDGNTGRSEEP